MLITTTRTDGLGDLPVELELAILAQLPLSALPSLACVCRRWHAHLKHLDFTGSNAALRAIRARVAFLLHQHGDRTVCAYLDNSPLDGTPFARSSAPSARRDYRVRNFNDASKRLRRLLVLLREFEGLERRYVENMARVCDIKATVVELLEPRTTCAIFANADEILALHQTAVLPGVLNALRHLPPPGSEGDEARTAALAERCLVELARLFARVAPYFMLHSDYLTSFFKKQPFAALDELLGARSPRCLPAGGDGRRERARRLVEPVNAELRTLLATPRSRLPRWNLLFQDLHLLLAGDGPQKEAGWRWAPETVAAVAVASARLRSVCVYLNEELEREVPSYIGRRDTLTGAWRQRAAPRGAVAEWLRRVRAVFWEEA